MTLNLRIFMAIFLVIGLGTYLFLKTITTELSPGIRQSSEDTLVEMSNLLAELVAQEYRSGQLQSDNFKLSVQRFLNRDFQADIYSVQKQQSDSRIYITDQQGIVVFDSNNEALGEDYSQWNDVYLTLRGEYGVRSSRIDPEDESSSVMHVAAPIYRGEEVIGVLTVAKPSLAFEPFIELTQTNINQKGILIVFVSLGLGAALALWLTRSIRALTNYADAITEGRNAIVPKLKETELNRLGQAMAEMRKELEGKDYVEKYVHSLTHELKSPVTSIKAAVELIDQNMPAERLEHFISNISHEADRLDDIVNRLLQLVKVENREVLENVEMINLVEIIKQVLQSKESIFEKKNIQMKLPKIDQTIMQVTIQGEKFLLVQALDNIVQNALDFCSQDGEIIISLERTMVDSKSQIIISIEDNGTGIPDYARDKIFERFYSLARPDNGKKSSGLGLSFVWQVMQLHQGSVTVDTSYTRGTLIKLILPLKQ